MRILLVALGLLLAAAVLYLLVDADPTEPRERGIEALHADDEKSAPTLGSIGLAKPDESKQERAAAEALFAELRDLDDKARCVLLSERFAQNSSWQIPYSDELARLFLQMTQSKDNEARSYGGMYLYMIGPRAAPLINEALTADPKGATNLALFRILANWRALGREFPVPDLMLFLGEGTPLQHGAVMRLIGHGVPFEERLAQRLLEMFRVRPIWDARGPGVGLARMGKEGPAILMEFFRAATSEGERAAALQCLARTRPEQLRPQLPALSALILDKAAAPGTRSIAIRTLMAMKGDCLECLPALRAALNDDSYEFLKPCAAVLGLMGKDAAPAVPDLLRWLEVDDPTIGDPTARALAQIGSSPDLCLPALQTMVMKFSSDAGAQAMAFFGPAALPHALKILDEGDEYARYAVLWAIAGLGEKAASVVPRLLDLVQGEDKDIALRAIGTLGYIGPKASAAVPEIMRRVHLGEETLGAKAAAGALARMGPDAEQALLQSLRSPKAEERSRALRVMTHFHLRSTFAFDDLEPLTAAKDSTTRADAYTAIGAAFYNPSAPWTRPTEGMDPELLKRGRALLEQGRQDKDPTVQSAVQAALAYLAAQEES